MEPYYAGFIPKHRCKHGAFVAQCFTELCEHSNGFDTNDPRRYFGAMSSGAEAQRLSLNPQAYAAMKKRAQELGIIKFS